VGAQITSGATDVVGTWDNEDIRRAGFRLSDDVTGHPEPRMEAIPLDAGLEVGPPTGGASRWRPL